MLGYTSIKNYRHTKHLNRLWNSEFRSTYPIAKNAFKSVLIENVHLNKNASFVALYDNEPVGFIFIKTWFNESGIVNENDKAYLSLIFVKKEMRNMGIGSDLLQLAISELKQYHNIKYLVVGNDMNRFFSGVPSEMNGASIFFVNKGFVQNEAVVDMIRIVRNDKVEELDTDLKISIATEEDKDGILQMCVRNNLRREAYLINEYFEKGGTGRRIVIGSIDNKICAFARFDDENKSALRVSAFDKSKDLGLINYVCVDSSYSDSNFEEIMNIAVKNYIILRGCKKIIVLATKNIQFYKKLGFSAYKYYLQFKLPLWEEK
ncbi:MAG: GNAT family N-acetyltransferase [Erysipelotrichaceae bacterium]|nr:GNAT family N-acetyltransferase [Erysipelotrichaceae bacterium]